MGGTVQKPEIKHPLADGGKGLVEGVKGKTMEQLRCKKQSWKTRQKPRRAFKKKEAEEKVKSEADRLKRNQKLKQRQKQIV